jgi:hypothetical protein
VNDERDALNWHPAFFQAIQVELYDYRSSLEFKCEYQLTSEPLRIDLLIIKKPENVTIDKNIAAIFRSDNLLEYKSPEDSISVKDFLKVYAYAALYAAISPDVDLSGVTLTFAGNRRPRKLMQYLAEVRGYKIRETSPGIHEVSGDYIPIQIIETKRLPERENVWLKSLANDLKTDGMKAILEEGRKQGLETPMGAYWDVILKANSKIFKEVLNMAEAATLEEVLTEAGLIPEWMERGRKQGIEQGIERGREQGREYGKEIIARNLLNMGMSIEETAQATELSVEKVRTFAT